MKCIHCQGELKRGTAPFQINRSRYHLVLEAVPAWVCTQCGEPYFEEQQVNEIQDVIATVDEKTGTLTVPA